MKTSTLRLFAVVILSFFLFPKLQSQTLYHFPQPGMQQVEIYHGDWTTAFYPYNRSFSYDSDSIVGTDTFAVYHIVNASTPYFTWYDQGKVYWNLGYSVNFSNPASWTKIYDFSMNVGDTMTLYGYTHSGLYTVDSVGTILCANGQQRKYMRLHNNYSDVVKWIDAIGDIEHGLTYYDDFEGGYNEFVCNSDSSGPVYSAPMSSYNCDMNNPVSYSGNDDCGIFNFNFQVTPDHCGNCDGTITISNVTGGVGAYSFSWSNGSTAMSQAGLCWGNYTVTITDANGTSCTHAFYVPASVLNATYTISNYNCSIGYASACVNVTGGAGPYTFVWSPSGNNTACENYLFPGNYTVCITDAGGCQTCVTVHVPPVSPFSAPATITNASCQSCCDGNIALNFSGGTPPYTIVTSPAWPSAGNFCPGNYAYTVTDSLGCTYSDTVMVSFTTGIAAQEENDFSVCPNPANEKLVLTFEDPNVSSEIQILDAQGREVLTAHASHAKQQEIDIAALPAGIYFIRVLSEDGSVSNEKISVVR